MKESIKHLLPVGRQRYNAHWCISLDGKLFHLEACESVVEKKHTIFEKNLLKIFFFGLLHVHLPSAYSSNIFQYFPLKLGKTFIINLDI